MLWNHLKDQAVNEAIDRAMRINVPGEISSALRQHADEVAHYFAQAWTQRSPTLATFLYLSPRMLVDGGPGNDGFKFDAHVKVQSIERDLVSIGAVEPSRRTIQDGPSYYEIEVRWSISQPIFTPFDIYRALVEYFAEHIVDSWVAHCYSGSKLSKDAKEDFYGCTAILAEVSATLKCEGYFALDAGDRSYLSQARSLRWEALQKLSVMIENELIPRVRRLESKRLISMDIIRWDAYWSSTRKGLDLGGERSLIPTMERVSLSMSHVEGKDLEYERLETSKWRADPTMRPFAVNNISHIAAQKRHELREFLKPLERYVPNLIPKEDTHVFDLSKPSFDS